MTPHEVHYSETFQIGDAVVAFRRGVRLRTEHALAAAMLAPSTLQSNPSAYSCLAGFGGGSPPPAICLDGAAVFYSR